MFYKLLGMAVWKGGKLFLRRKYGPTYAPRPLVAGAVLIAALGVVLALMRRDANTA